MRKIGRIVAGMVASVVMTAVTLVAIVPPAGAATACADWLIVGARGSGQPYNDGYQGAGPENFAVYQRIAAQVGGSKRFEGLYYPAVAIDWTVISASTVPYWNSVAAGVSALTAKVRAETAACPRQRYVLLGYSQGANVVGDSMAALNADPYLRDRFGGASLLGDPEFNPTLAVDRGNYSRSRYGVFPALIRTPQREVPARFVPNTISWCDVYDYVCNFSWSNFVAHQPACRCGHFNYIGAGMTRDTGNWLAARMKSMAPPA